MLMFPKSDYVQNLEPQLGGVSLDWVSFHNAPIPNLSLVGYKAH